MDDLLKDFVVECNEILAKLDQDLIALEKNPNDAEVLKGVFRLLHSIKGTGGMLGLSRLEKVAHAAEDLLGRVRDGEVAINSEIINVILQAIDVIKLVMQSLAATGQEPNGEDRDLIEKLRAVADSAGPVLSAAQAAVAAVAFKGTGEVNANIAHVSRVAEESSRTAVEIQKASGQLSGLSSQMDKTIKEFLRKLGL